MNLLVAGTTLFSNEDCPELERMGYKVTFLGREDVEKIETPEIFHVVVCNWLFQHQDIRRFTQLRAIQLLSAGMDRVPLDYIQQRGIELCNARGVYSIPMAEYAVMTVLDYLKSSAALYANQQDHLWNKIRSVEELHGKTVCVLGMGSVGCEVAKRFAAFTGRIIGVDLTPLCRPFFTETYSICELDKALEQSDVVVVTLPLTDQTRGLLNAEFFAKMKRGCIVVNIARGGLVQPAALKQAIEAGIVRYAILDVFEQEPLAECDWRWASPQVRVTPHCSFISVGNNGRLRQIVVNNLREWSLLK